MDFDALLPQLRARYPFLDDERLRKRTGIREPDVQLWAAAYGENRGLFYDAFARYLALGFHEGKLSFAFCDSVLNDLEQVITTLDDERPDLYWEVYLAFDAGEYHRSDDRSDDPVAEYTEPAIANIVGSL